MELNNKEQKITVLTEIYDKKNDVIIYKKKENNEWKNISQDEYEKLTREE